MLDDRLKISVITVCKNAEKYISDCISSVRSQSHRVNEHLIIDGLSQDGTLARIPQEYFDSGWVVSETDDGIYHAMNKGLNRFCGDIVCFLNSDDIFAGNDVVGDVVRAFQDERVIAVWGDLIYCDQDSFELVSRYWRSSPISISSYSNGWVPPHPGLFVRRAALDAIGDFDLTYGLAADYDWLRRLVRLLREEEGAYLSKVLVKMRLGGVTNRSYGNVFRQNCEIWDILRREYRVMGVLKIFVSRLFFKISQLMIHRL